MFITGHFDRGSKDNGINVEGGLPALALRSRVNDVMVSQVSGIRN
jgi:hypothetical protein